MITISSRRFNQPASRSLTGRSDFEIESGVMGLGSFGVGSRAGLPLIRLANPFNASALVTFSEMPNCIPSTSPSSPFVFRLPVLPQCKPALGQLIVTGGRLVPSDANSAPGRVHPIPIHPTKVPRQQRPINRANKNVLYAMLSFPLESAWPPSHLAFQAPSHSSRTQSKSNSIPRLAKRSCNSRWQNRAIRPDSSIPTAAPSTHRKAQPKQTFNHRRLGLGVGFFDTNEEPNLRQRSDKKNSGAFKLHLRRIVPVRQGQVTAVN